MNCQAPCLAAKLSIASRTLGPKASKQKVSLFSLFKLSQQLPCAKPYPNCNCLSLFHVHLLSYRSYPFGPTLPTLSTSQQQYSLGDCQISWNITTYKILKEKHRKTNFSKILSRVHDNSEKRRECSRYTCWWQWFPTNLATWVCLNTCKIGSECAFQYRRKLEGTGKGCVKTWLLTALSSPQMHNAQLSFMN